MIIALNQILLLTYLFNVIVAEMSANSCNKIHSLLV